MANLLFLFLLLLLSIFFFISSFSSARTPPQSADQTITFLVNNILDGSPRSSAGPITGLGSPPLPQSAPSAGFLPAANYGGGSTTTNPSPSATATFAAQHGKSTSSSSWVRILASWRALEAGIVTEIDEELTGDVARFGHQPAALVGKVQGIYVTSREKDSSHIVAMKVTFGGEGGDSLRLFGVIRGEQAESHIAVVGGAGKYGDANGYAVLRAVNPTSGFHGERESKDKVFNVTVHL